MNLIHDLMLSHSFLSHNFFSLKCVMTGKDAWIRVTRSWNSSVSIARANRESHSFSPEGFNSAFLPGG